MEVVESGRELRLQVGDNPATVKVISGIAECFGAELVPGKQYSIQGKQSYGIFCKSDSKLELNGTFKYRGQGDAPENKEHTKLHWFDII
ncbi:MAG: hypothetical protein EZS28_034069, partial [Streblomastix strix]